MPPSPEFKVWINGSELPPEAMADAISVAVHEDVEAPGMFVLRMNNWDMQQLKVTWTDSALFAAGNETKIEMGYTNQLQTLFWGEITGLEPEFSSTEVPLVNVRGFDGRHRLLRGRKTRSFLRVKDSEIAAQIANDVGLSVEIDDTGVTLDYVLQHNQTDMEFLEERARQIGYEVTITDKTLGFRERKNAESAVAVLKRDEDILEFYPRLSTMTQVGEVSVRGWDPRKKESIVAHETSLNATMGSTSGPAAASKAFGKAKSDRVDQPVFTQAEADQIAKGWFNNLAMAYISGDGVCIGRTDLRAGAVVKLEGLGERFGGSYYVTSTIHTYSPNLGYRTAFTVRRNAT